MHSTIWGEHKNGAKERYDEMGDARFVHMTYLRKRDRKVSYVEPDYDVGGSVRKVFGMSNQKQANVAIKHVGGTVAKLKNLCR